MRKSWKISLYYKLFFVFGLTFIGVVRVLGDSLQRPFDPDDARIIGIQLATCVFLLLLNTFAVRHLLSPLKRLNEASRELSEGRFQSRVSVRTRDEIGELGESFNNMANRLEAQMESLKHMAVGVSHEIRTPLTRMRLAVEMMDESKTKDLLAEQIHEIDSITGSILEREALDSGITSLQLQNIDLHELLNDLVAHYKESDHNLDLQCERISIRVDRRRLEMCLKNLLDNSFRHSINGEPVNIRAVETEAHSVLITILDKGSSGEDSKSGGYGLGLKLSESIAKAHGGSLKIDIQKGGSRAQLQLPRS